MFPVTLMELLCFWSNLLIGLFLSGLCVRSSFAFLPPQHAQHVLFHGAELPESHQSSTHSEEQKEREQVNTVRVTCHPDSMEIVMKADLFAVGAAVSSNELRLGVEDSFHCRATPSSEDEYRIVAGLVDCGTKHWMTEDSLVYTNLLIYSPVASPNWVIRMDEAVIPIECHYERKYKLSSSSLTPTWIPFTATQAAVELLEFSLRLMTDDWLHQRPANVFYLGEPISMEASVRVGYHMGLRVFVSSCVATLHPDIHSEPRYIFVDDGCLVDSQLPGSRAHFLPRTQDDRLQLLIDAFKFHNDDRGELYVTCHLNAVPVNDAEAPHKACTLVNGRWRSADGNDYLCGYCQSQNEVGQTTSPGKLGPRGFGKPAEPEASWKSGLKTNRVWEQEAKVGPIMVLPSRKSGPVPLELPPVLNKISRHSLYGSHWRSGINTLDLGKGLPDLEPTDEDEEVTSETDLEVDEDAAPLEKAGPGFKVKSLVLPEDDYDDTDTNATTAAPSDVSATPQINVDETTPSNTTTNSEPKK